MVPCSTSHSMNIKTRMFEVAMNGSGMKGVFPLDSSRMFYA